VVNSHIRLDPAMMTLFAFACVFAQSLHLISAWSSPSPRSMVMSAVIGETPLKVKVADALISSLFKFKPLFKMASSKAR
jgi:hypothetical protein